MYFAIVAIAAGIQNGRTGIGVKRVVQFEAAGQISAGNRKEGKYTRRDGKLKRAAEARGEVVVVESLGHERHVECVDDDAATVEDRADPKKKADALTIR